MIRKEKADAHRWARYARSTEEVYLCSVEDEESDAIVTYLFADSGQYGANVGARTNLTHRYMNLLKHRCWDCTVGVSRRFECSK